MAGVRRGQVFKDTSYTAAVEAASDQAAAAETAAARANAAADGLDGELGAAQAGYAALEADLQAAVGAAVLDAEKLAQQETGEVTLSDGTATGRPSAYRSASDAQAWATDALGAASDSATYAGEAHQASGLAEAARLAAEAHLFEVAAYAESAAGLGQAAHPHYITLGPKPQLPDSAPDSGPVPEGVIGRYTRSDALLQHVEREGGQWVDVGEPLPAPVVTDADGQIPLSAPPAIRLRDNRALSALGPLERKPRMVVETDRFDEATGDSSALGRGRWRWNAESIGLDYLYHPAGSETRDRVKPTGGLYVKPDDLERERLALYVTLHPDGVLRGVYHERPEPEEASAWGLYQPERYAFGGRQHLAFGAVAYWRTRAEVRFTPTDTRRDHSLERSWHTFPRKARRPPRPPHVWDVPGERARDDLGRWAHRLRLRRGGVLRGSSGPATPSGSGKRSASWRPSRARPSSA